MRGILWVVLAVVWGVAAPAQENTRGVLTVSGEGSVEVAPDMAIITLGVQNQATTADVAMRDTSRATQGILDRMLVFGVAQTDLQTSRLSLSPVFDRRANDGSPPRVVGFVASNEITVRLRDVPRVGALLDEVIQAGANTFRNLRFAVQDPGPHLDAARRAAVRDARARAALYAEAADLKLDGLRRLSEGGQGGRPGPQFETLALARDAVPVAPGELSISASVELEYWVSLAN